MRERLSEFTILQSNVPPLSPWHIQSKLSWKMSCLSLPNQSINQKLFHWIVNFANFQTNLNIMETKYFFIFFKHCTGKLYYVIKLQNFKRKYQHTLNGSTINFACCFWLAERIKRSKAINEKWKDIYNKIK